MKGAKQRGKWTTKRSNLFLVTDPEVEERKNMAKEMSEEKIMRIIRTRDSRLEIWLYIIEIPWNVNAKARY